MAHMARMSRMLHMAHKSHTAPRLRRSALAAAVLLGLAGCAVGPDYHRPAADPPAAYSAAAAAPGDPPARTATPIDAALWWHFLQDAELDKLVDEALQSNPALAIAVTRLQQAQAFEMALTGFALPRLDAAAGGGRGSGSDLSRGHLGAPLASADHVLPNAQINTVAGGQALWDIDLFGKFRRAIEAARYDAQAAAAARDAVQIALIADVARAYVNLRGLQMELAVQQQNLSAARKLRDIVQARYDRGITNEYDLMLATREYATVQASVAPLQAQIATAGYAIAVLLGRYPEDMAVELAQPGVIPAIPDAIASGVPLDLIRRRPDVRQAEWELAGATARIGVATANLFPQLSLSAGLGVQAQGPALSTSSHQRIWSVGYGAVLPLLDFGTLDALVTVADLQARERLFDYRATVQAAVQDVDTALATFRGQRQRLDRLGEAVTAAQRATALATQRYDRGLSDFLNVVDAQRQEYDLEGQYVQAQVTLGEQFVGLYRGLGGGWENYSGAPPSRVPEPAVMAMFRRLVQPATGLMQ